MIESFPSLIVVLFSEDFRINSMDERKLTDLVDEGIPTDCWLLNLVQVVRVRMVVI